MTSLPLKAVLFDMDGVLFDSTAAHEAAFRAVFKEIGIRSFRYREIAGMRTDAAFAHLLKDRGVQFTRAQVGVWTARKRKLAYAQLKRRTALRRGAMRVLKELKNRFILALVSSAEAEKVRLFLRSSGTRSLFSLVIAGNLVRRAKPHPEIYLKAIRRLGIKSEEALVVEDAVFGVQAAHRAGIPVVGLSGTCSKTALRKAGAKRVFNRLTELVPYATNF